CSSQTTCPEFVGRPWGLSVEKCNIHTPASLCWISDFKAKRPLRLGLSPDEYQFYVFAARTFRARRSHKSAHWKAQRRKCRSAAKLKSQSSLNVFRRQASGQQRLLYLLSHGLGFCGKKGPQFSTLCSFGWSTGKQYRCQIIDNAALEVRRQIFPYRHAKYSTRHHGVCFIGSSQHRQLETC